jgi:hypothetical protein
MSAADEGFYTESAFRVRVTSNLRFPQYGGLLGSVANALNEAIDGHWRIKRLRRMVAEYGLKLEPVLAYLGTTVDEIREFNRPA